MAVQIDKFTGLHFTNNEVSALPPGAAEDCENVIVNKFNLLEPRRGYYFSDIGTAPSQWTSFNDRKVTNHFQTPDASTDFFVRENSPPAIYNQSVLVAAPLLTGTYQDLFPIGKTRPKMVFYNGCNYLLASTTSTGTYGSLYEFHTGNKNRPYLRRAGVPSPASINSVDASGTTFPQNSVQSYSAVFVYLNQGGAKIKSAPSTTRQHTVNQVGGAKVTITVTWSPKDISPDREAGKFVLQVYRTKTSTTGVSDIDFKLIKEVTLSETDLGAGTYTFTDDVADSARGEELYANESIGIEPKLQSPAAVDVCLFKDRLWAAGVYDDQPETVLTLVGTSGSVSTTNVTASINGKVLCAITADSLIYFGTSTGYAYKFDGTTVTALTGATGVGGNNSPCYSLVKANGKLYALAGTTGSISVMHEYVSGTTWTTTGTVPPLSQLPYWHSLVSIGSWLYWVQESATPSGPTFWHRICGWNPLTGQSFGAYTIMTSGTATIAYDCLTAAPRNLVDPSSTDTSKVPVIAYIQDNKPTIAWLNVETTTWTTLYQGSTDTAFAKFRPYYSAARNELFVFAEYTAAGLGRPRDVWKVNANGTLAISTSTAVQVSFDTGCSWMGDVNGSHAFGSIKGTGTNWARLNIVKSTNFHDSSLDILYDGTTDSATEYLRALYYNGAVISFVWNGTTTLMRSLANGALQSSDTIVIGGQTYTASTSETASTFIIDTTSGSASVRIAATAKSLVNVINKYNQNCTASYISVDTANVGLILIKGKNGTGASGIYGNKISCWAPDATRANPAGLISVQQYNQLRFSEIYEPQAWPLVNERFAGAPEDKVLRIASTKDSLFIVKQHSVWVVRGESLTPILLDDTVSCIAPDSVTKLNNQIYFLSNKGIAVCSDSGVSIEGQQITAIFDKGNSTYADAYGFAVEKYNSYFFILKDPFDSYYRKCFVYNTVSQAITKFEFDCEVASGSVVFTPDEAGGKSPKVVFHPFSTGISDSFSYRLELTERYSTNSTFWQTDFTEVSFSHNPTGYTVAYQISGVVRHTYPKVGDKVVRAPSARTGVVSSVGSFGSSSSFAVAWDDGLADDALWSGQTYTFKRPIQAFYKLAPIYAGAPHIRKHFTSFELSWQSQPADNATVSFHSDLGATLQVASTTVRGSASQYENQREKSFSRVPNNAARANALSMKLSVPTTTAWSLAAVNIAVEGGTEK